MKFNKRARLSTKFLRFFFSGTYNAGLKDSEERLPILCEITAERKGKNI